MTTQTSRRAVLAGVAVALPSLAVLPAHAAPNSAEKSESSPMFGKLIAAMRETKQKWDVAWDDHADREQLSFDERPDSPKRREMSKKLAKKWRALPIGKSGKLPASHPVEVYFKQSEAEFQKNVKAWDRACRRIETKHGVREAQKLMDDPHDEYWDVGRRIITAPAQNIGDIAIKFEAIDLLGIREDMESIFNDFEPIAAIAADVRAIAGKAVRS